MLLIIGLFFCLKGYAFNDREKSRENLKFIHIAKTGGTSIEDIGKAGHMLWGRHMHEYGWWHESFRLLSATIKSKYDWFVVVRNPYSRIVSEFHCRWGGVGDAAMSYNTTTFNEYIRKRMAKTHPLGDHYTPQFHYVEFSSKWNLYILHFENLEVEFDQLMLLYNISNVKLGGSKWGHGTTTGANGSTLKNINGHRHIFTEQDIDLQSKKIIDEKYCLDFDMFSYNYTLPNYNNGEQF
jgi:hypothetical protein